MPRSPSGVRPLVLVLLMLATLGPLALAWPLRGSTPGLTAATPHEPVVQRQGVGRTPGSVARVPRRLNGQDDGSAYEWQSADGGINTSTFWMVIIIIAVCLLLLVCVVSLCSRYDCCGFRGDDHGRVGAMREGSAGRSMRKLALCTLAHLCVARGKTLKDHAAMCRAPSPLTPNLTDSLACLPHPCSR